MATIAPRKNRDGQVIGYQVKIRRTGFPTQSKTFETKTDAKRWAAEMESEISRGVFVDRSEAERNTLGDLIRRYQTDITPTKLGGDKEKGHLAVILDDQISLMRMTMLASKDVGAFRDRMAAAAYAPATIVRRLNLIATVINHARSEWGVHVVDNMASAKLTARPKGADRKRERRLQPARVVAGQEECPAEEEILFKALAAGRHAALTVPLARLAIETAARQGELCSLDWKDVDLEKRVMTIRGLSGVGSKSGDVRRVPLSSAAVEAIRSLPGFGAKAGRLFPVDQNALKITFARTVGKKIPDLTFHDLRHEATSRLAKVYTNPLELMRVTGHKTLSMLSRYYHADAEELAQRLA
ncbi:site-specific integrase [Nitrospirillum pindoramense]|uniref:Integrase n=1 Tax=Nitrospirillum amazonense TaxID=28077 RepID=A0A560HIH3_9PROT|nr:site-specific integrase [Nitrospirillum amazonense]TWB45801.1 integrase [Nitrospirillum amazonense]